MAPDGEAARAGGPQRSMARAHTKRVVIEVGHEVREQILTLEVGSQALDVLPRWFEQDDVNGWMPSNRLTPDVARGSGFRKLT